MLHSSKFFPVKLCAIWYSAVADAVCSIRVVIFQAINITEREYDRSIRILYSAMFWQGNLAQYKDGEFVTTKKTKDRRINIDKLAQSDNTLFTKPFKFICIYM